MTHLTRQELAGMALPAVAAAVLILALVVPRSALGPLSAPSAGVRGTDIVAFIPIGPVRRVTEFRWASPVEASRYILVVRNTGAAEILRREITDQQLRIGPDLAGRFPPGRYTWIVEALDRDGRTIATSRIQTFEIR